MNMQNSRQTETQVPLDGKNANQVFLELHVKPVQVISVKSLIDVLIQRRSVVLVAKPLNMWLSVKYKVH